MEEMKSIEVSAKTVEEAINIALNKLGLSHSEVKIEILSRGKSGILGIGGEEARVRVTPLTPGGEKGSEEESEVAKLAKEIMEKLLFLLKIPATVNVEGKEPVSVNITDGKEDLGILIGRKGRTLASLQYLVSLMVSRKIKARPRLNIDIAGYKKRHEEELRRLALKIAELVKRTGRSITLEAMPPHERRIIHLALRDDPEVITRSSGEGEERRVTISPRRRAQSI